VQEAHETRSDKQATGHGRGETRPDAQTTRRFAMVGTGEAASRRGAVPNKTGGEAEVIGVEGAANIQWKKRKKKKKGDVEGREKER
jgi:hypothetical protein